MADRGLSAESDRLQVPVVWGNSRKSALLWMFLASASLALAYGRILSPQILTIGTLPPVILSHLFLSLMAVLFAAVSAARGSEPAILRWVWIIGLVSVETALRLHGFEWIGLGLICFLLATGGGAAPLIWRLGFPLAALLVGAGWSERLAQEGSTSWFPAMGLFMGFMAYLIRETRAESNRALDRVKLMMESALSSKNGILPGELLKAEASHLNDVESEGISVIFQNLAPRKEADAVRSGHGVSSKPTEFFEQGSLPPHGLRRVSAREISEVLAGALARSGLRILPTEDHAESLSENGWFEANPQRLAELIEHAVFIAKASLGDDEGTVSGHLRTIHHRIQIIIEDSGHGLQDRYLNRLQLPEKYSWESLQAAAPQAAASLFRQSRLGAGSKIVFELRRVQDQSTSQRAARPNRSLIALQSP